MTAAFAIRRGRAGDLDALERLENTTFDGDRLSRRSLGRFLSAPTTHVAVAEEPQGLAGYAMIGFRAGSSLGRVFSLAVDPAHARHGIGSALMAACEVAAEARGSTAVRLEVRSDNGAAIALYQARGYAAFGAIPDYYEDGTTALRFEKRLALPARAGSFSTPGSLGGGSPGA